MRLFLEQAAIITGNNTDESRKHFRKSIRELAKERVVPLTSHRGCARGGPVGAVGGGQYGGAEVQDGGPQGAAGPAEAEGSVNLDEELDLIDIHG